MTITSSFMLHVATALLPPHDEIDYEYYKILNLPKKGRSTTIQQIRKAYKVLSLQLHPDKVVQRNGNIEEAALLYEKVQEAVAVLSDDTKRQIYINYNYSVARYKFIYEQHGLLNMMQVIQNLQKSSCIHRTKLWLFVLVFTLVLLLLQPILIAMKVNSITGTTTISTTVNRFMNTSWFLILIPFWIFSGFYISLRIIVLFKFLRERRLYGPPTKLPKAVYYSILGMSSDDFDTEGDDDDDNDDDANENINHDNNNRNNSTNNNNGDDITNKEKNKNGGVPTSELIIHFLNFYIPSTIVAGIIMLILQWENDESFNSRASVQFYCSIAGIILLNCIKLQQIRFVQSSMISNANGIVVASTRRRNSSEFNSIDDENVNSLQQQRRLLQQKYLIVQPDPEKLVMTLEIVRQMKLMHQEEGDEELTTITDEEMEYIRIQCSEEYQLLERLKKVHYQSIGTVVLIYVTQLTLVLMQLQNTINVSSWYIIFIPLLIYYGVPILSYCCYCCCTATSRDDIHLTTHAPTTTTDSNDADTTAMNNANNNDGNRNDIENHSNDISGVVPSSSLDPVVVSTTVQATESDNDTNEENHATAAANLSQGKDNDTTTNTEHSSMPTATATNGHNINVTNNSTTSSPEDKDDDDDDDPHLHQNFDPDEERDRAQRGISCCSSCFMLILLCLVIAKIEQSYDVKIDDDDKDDGSFNTMWILFPLFLLSGCIVCLFTLCICIPANPDGTDIVFTDTKVNNATTGTSSGSTSQSSPTAAGATTTAATSNFTVPSTSNSNQNSEQTMTISPPPAIIESDTIASAVAHSVTDHPTSTTSGNYDEMNNDIEVGGNGRSNSNICDLD